MKILLGGGMDITGTIMCGDYIYSGHTAIIISMTLFILEYTPKKFILYRVFCQTLAAVGIVCIIFSHEHYTVDIILAYYVATNHFWMFHAMTEDIKYKTASPRPWRPGPHLTRVWWWRIFLFMEKNVTNVQPEFKNPIPSAKKYIVNYYENIFKRRNLQQIPPKTDV